MEKKIINPWNWQEARSYAQAIEVKNNQSTLYVSGQAAIDEAGISSKEDMRSQLVQSLKNLEKVILHAGYALNDIVRLTIYTTSNEELMQNFDLLQDWLQQHHIIQTTSVIEVKNLFETLKVELEATAAT